MIISRSNTGVHSLPDRDFMMCTSPLSIILPLFGDGPYQNKSGREIKVSEFI